MGGGREKERRGGIRSGKFFLLKAFCTGFGVGIYRYSPL